MIRRSGWVAVLVFSLTLLTSVSAYAQDECPAIPAGGPGVQRIEGHYIVLVDLAHQLADAHVYVQPGNSFADPKALAAGRAALPNLWGGV